MVIDFIRIAFTDSLAPAAVGKLEKNARIHALHDGTFGGLKAFMASCGVDRFVGSPWRQNLRRRPSSTDGQKALWAIRPFFSALCIRTTPILSPRRGSLKRTASRASSFTRIIRAFSPMKKE
jgi:hypothetical protein